MEDEPALDFTFLHSKSSLNITSYRFNAPPASLFNSTSTERSLGTNFTSEDIRLSSAAQIVLVTVYSLTTLLAVIGNAIAILVFTIGKCSRTDLRVFLLNLAISDLIMALFCMPFTFTFTMLENWVFSAPMCPIVLFMQTMSVTASVSTNMAIGIDRFWAVTFPLKTRAVGKRSKLVICIIWLIAIAFSSIQLVVGRSRAFEPSPGVTIHNCEEEWPEPHEVWRTAYTFFILVLTYILPLCILAFTYGWVALKLWQRTAPGNADAARDLHQLRAKRKVVKMLITVVLMFGMCWLPLHVFILTLDFNTSLTSNPTAYQQYIFTVIYYCVHWMAMSNSFVNPVVYGFLNDAFKKDLHRLISRGCPCVFRCCPAYAKEQALLGTKQYSRWDQSHRLSNESQSQHCTHYIRSPAHSPKLQQSCVHLNGSVTRTQVSTETVSLLGAPDNTLSTTHKPEAKYHSIRARENETVL